MTGETKSAQRSGTPAISYLNGLVTVIERPVGDYMAHVSADKNLWDIGRTPDEAVDRVVKTHQQAILDGIAARAQAGRTDTILP